METRHSMEINKKMVQKYKAINSTRYKEDHKSKSQPGGTAMINTNSIT